MKLKELEKIIEATNKYGKDSGELEVVVKTCNASMGQTSAVKVSRALAGFDWDAGRFIIYPKESLVLEGTTRDEVKPPLDFNKTFPQLADPTAKRISWMCQNCEQKVAGTDVYCKRCGQRLK